MLGRPLLHEQVVARSDFRGFLQRELADRCRANPNYSLRSFARSLKIEPSALSQILNKKRPLTEKMKFRLGNALGLDTAEISRIPETGAGYQQISLDTFAAISDWYHFAILELTYLKDFRLDSGWISRKLKITRSEANIAVERLVRLGLLKKNAKGRWVDGSANGNLTHLNPTASSTAARNYQIQLLKLSQRAVQEVPFVRRSHSSATLCFDLNDLPEAIEFIGKFRRSFARKFQPKQAATEVYQLQVSLYPLTHPVLSKEKL